MQGLTYNSQLPPLRINEYGRNLQRFVNHIIDLKTKEERTKACQAMVISVMQMNPNLKEVENGEQIVWNYLHLISEFKLDVDSPYPLPKTASHLSKPPMLDYPTSRIKYRYYGKNLQKLVKNSTEISSPENKQKYIDVLGSFMKNSGKNWNNEEMSDKQIVEHLKVLSQGKLNLSVDEIDTGMEIKQRNTSGFKKKGKRNNKHHNHRNKRRR
jgi:hypothetical protein